MGKTTKVVLAVVVVGGVAYLFRDKLMALVGRASPGSTPGAVTESASASAPTQGSGALSGLSSVLSSGAGLVTALAKAFKGDGKEAGSTYVTK